MKLTKNALLALPCALLAANASAQSTIFVDDDHPNDPGPGNPFVSSPLEDGSAMHPFDSIQEGIDAASNGDTVLVSSGTYFEVTTLDISGSAGPKTLHILGEDGPQTTIIDASAHTIGVRAQQGETNATVFEGFTIRGAVNGTNPGDSAGGMSVIGSSPTIRNCWFRENTAYIGAGLYFNFSSLVLEDCVFMDNDAAHQGGGVYGSSSSPMIRRCLFEANGASFGAGALFRTVPGNVVRIEDSAFEGNVSQGYGGGLAKFDQGILYVDRTRFLSNVAATTGGGVHIHNRARITSCIFSTNTAGTASGGGAFAADGGGSGGVSLMEVFSSTLFNNFGGGVGRNFAPVHVRNSIVWDNTDYQIQPGAAVTYCDVMGGYPGAGNIDADPLFNNVIGPDMVVGTSDDDYSLRRPSPAPGREHRHSR